VALNYAVDLGFLETDRLAVKTQIFDYCILLDFLGFSRPNPDFGFTGSSLKFFHAPGSLTSAAARRQASLLAR
jgi:hypothetical protein